MTTHKMNKKDFAEYRLTAEKNQTIYLTFEFSGGTCQLWHKNSKLQFSAGGYGYDKISTVFGNFMDEYFETQKLLKRKSVKGLYGHRNGFFSYGVGIDCHKTILDNLRGFKFEYITETKTAIVYKLTYDGTMLRSEYKALAEGV